MMWEDAPVHSLDLDLLSQLRPVLLFSLSVESNSLHPHGLQRAWLPCPSGNEDQ